MIRTVNRFPFSLMPEYGKEELTAEVLRGMNNHIMVNLVTVQPHTITKSCSMERLSPVTQNCLISSITGGLSMIGLLPRWTE